MSKGIFKPMRSAAVEVAYTLPFPVYVSPKLDGIRLAKPGSNSVTKSGKSLPNVHIREWVDKHVPAGFDGEIISGSPTDEDCYQRTFSAAMTIAGAPDFSYYVFDLCDKEGAESLFATDRYSNLKRMWQGLPDGVKAVVKLVEKTVVNNDVELSNYYDKCIAEGYEGVVIQDLTGYYKWGKSSPKTGPQWKDKPFSDAEAVITGFYEAEENQNEAFKNELGETKRSTHHENKVGKDTLGGFLATDVVTGAELRVPCGKMKHDERKAVWDRRSTGADLGRFIKYRYMTYGVVDLPRHLRWIGWRDAVDMEPKP